MGCSSGSAQRHQPPRAPWRGTTEHAGTTQGRTASARAGARRWVRDRSELQAPASRGRAGMARPLEVRGFGTHLLRFARDGERISSRRLRRPRPDTPSGAATVRRPDWRASYESRALDAKTGLGWAELIKDTGARRRSSTPRCTTIATCAWRSRRSTSSARSTVFRRARSFRTSTARRAGGAREARDPSRQNADFNAIQVTAESAVGARFLGAAAQKHAGRARRVSGE